MWLKLQFFLALTVAAIDDSWQKAKGIKHALGTRQQVSDELRSLRLEHCKKCPIYSRALSTCGTPFRDSAPDMRGCYCHAPTICGCLENCWKYDFEKGNTKIGWPKELNSFPVPDLQSHLP